MYVAKAISTYAISNQKYGKKRWPLVIVYNVISLSIKTNKYLINEYRNNAQGVRKHSKGKEMI